MMEQAYGTTEDQIREVKSIARRFLGKTQNYQGFSKSFKTSVEEQVNKKVLGLLQEQKPKVLVYGIYNAGKSTLVNVLCGKEVAEVGDRPTTAKTQPYDAGKYILMDTPGIDAPIEHEMEADEYILTTTTTEYGSKLAIESGSDDTIAKPLLKDEFITLIETNEFNLLIDATHPYASHITQTTVSLSKLFNITYIRFERPPSNLDNVDTSRVHEVTSLDEAGKLIASDFTSGNVLHLAGANTMEAILKYVPVNRFYARILKVPKSLEKCKLLNVPEEHIIEMKGTSSLEENLKIIEETQASVIITKESGDIGGVINKINAANLKDIGVIMLKRPKIKDLNKKDIVSNLDELDEKINNYF